MMKQPATPREKKIWAINIATQHYVEARRSSPSHEEDNRELLNTTMKSFKFVMSPTTNSSCRISLS